MNIIRRKIMYINNSPFPLRDYSPICVTIPCISVRKYKDEPIPEDILATLLNKVWEINKEAVMLVQFVTDEPREFCRFKSASRVFPYGVLTGARVYFIMARKKGDEVDEKIGYYGERLVMRAQSLGLKICWVGLIYSNIPGAYELADDEKIACYISPGYGQTQGKSHKSKPVREISNASDLTPKWFNRGVEAALLATTARQPKEVLHRVFGIQGLQPCAQGHGQAGLLNGRLQQDRPRHLIIPLRAWCQKGEFRMDVIFHALK